MSLLKLVRALATAPMLQKLPEDPESRNEAEKALAECDDAVLSKLEAAFVDAGAFAADALSECEAVERRNVLLLYWHMNHTNLTDLAATCVSPARASCRRAALRP